MPALWEESQHKIREHWPLAGQGVLSTPSSKRCRADGTVPQGLSRAIGSQTQSSSHLPRVLQAVAHSGHNSDMTGHPENQNCSLWGPVYSAEWISLSSKCHKKITFLFLSIAVSEMGF